MHAHEVAEPVGGRTMQYPGTSRAGSDRTAGTGLYTNIRRSRRIELHPVEMRRDEDHAVGDHGSIAQQHPPLVSLGSGNGIFRHSPSSADIATVLPQNSPNTVPGVATLTGRHSENASGTRSRDATRRRSGRMPRSPGRSPKRSARRRARMLSSPAARRPGGQLAPGVGFWIVGRCDGGGCIRVVVAVERSAERSSRRRSTPPIRP